MIWNVIPMFNEIELLKLRLDELGGVVDRFVCIEAPFTFTGKPKPLHISDNKREFQTDKIIHAVFDAWVATSNPWHREFFNKNAGLPYMKDLKDDDIVICTDADEIPTSASVTEAAERKEFPMVFEQVHHLYFFNCIRTTEQPWRYSLAVSGRMFREFNFCGWHRHAHVHGLPVVCIRSAGWHFAYLGGAQNVIYKIESFSHGVEDSAKHLVEQYKSGLNPWDVHAKQIQFVPVDGALPRYVLERVDDLTRRGYIHIPCLTPNP